jgi:ribosomal protein S18 acetylase RimI-like enzyme
MSAAADSCLVRPAERARDNAALCALARRCPQGQRLRFYHQRDDFWERCRLQPAALVLAAEQGGRVAGSVTVARKELVLAGHGHQPTAYVCDLMVDPGERGRGLGRTLLRVARRVYPDARLTYSYILEDNTPSRHLFEGEGFVTHPRRLLYHVLLPRMARYRPWTGCTEAEPDGETAAMIDAALAAHYGWLDTAAGIDGLFRAERGATQAWGALRRHGPQVFVGLPWYAALLGRLLPLLPRPGRPVHIWSLHHLVASGPGAGAALRDLVRALARRAVAAGIDAVALPLFDNDPLAANLTAITLTRWGIPPGATRLCLAGDLAGELLAADRPLLMSGKDA